MSLFRDVVDSFFSGSGFMGGGMNTYYGTLDSYEELISKDKEVEPRNISVVYTCSRIIAGAISLMPIDVSRDGEPLKDHKYYYKIKHRLNDNQNNQVFWSTVSFMKSVYGNAFADLRKDSIDIIPIEVVEDWRYDNKGKLEYKFNWNCKFDYVGKSRYKDRKEEWVSCDKVLHFKGLSLDGVMGLPPISAAHYNLSITNKATQTIESFYKNNAMSPMSLESTLPDSVNSGKLMIEQVDKFKNKYTGAKNAGKPMFLPPNTKLTPIQIAFQDAQLIDTLKFSRDEICNMYGIPSFMHTSTDVASLDIEQQSRSFVSMCISPEANIFKSELEYKLLSKKEVIDNTVIEFDTMALIQSDFVSLSTAFKGLVQSGIASPNDGSRALKLPVSSDPLAEERFVQAQLIALSDYAQANPIINNKANTKQPEKKEDKE